MEKNKAPNCDGGSAFPVVKREVWWDVDPVPRKSYNGMSLREWFAGKALPGLIAIDPDASPEGIARDAYLYADAMIAARDREE